MKEKKVASALSFDPKKDNAPNIVASGKGELAEDMIAIAQEHDVPVYKDAPLAKALGQLEVGDLVTPELYTAVAEVLAFVYSLDQNQDIKNEITGRL